MTAYRWQRYKGPFGQSWELVPATVTAPGFLALTSIAKVWPLKPGGHGTFINCGGTVQTARVAYTSAARAKAFVGRQLSQLPNPPSIVGGQNA